MYYSICMKNNNQPSIDQQIINIKNSCQNLGFSFAILGNEDLKITVFTDGYKYSGDNGEYKFENYQEFWAFVTGFQLAKMKFNQ